MTVGGMSRGLERQSLTMAPSASGGAVELFRCGNGVQGRGSTFPQVNTGT
jgi:hypothetical protein